DYKQIQYKTNWVNFPDIGTILAAAGAPPTRRTGSGYTVPAILDGDKAISDSRVIAEYVESTYPARPVPLCGTMYGQAIEANVVSPMISLIVPFIVNHLNGRDSAYYVQSRRERWGKELHKICPLSQHEEIVRALEDGPSKLSDFAGEASQEGWIFGRNGPVYEDFEVIGWFLCLKFAGLPGLWERIKELNRGKWGRLLNAAESLMNVD
ncbi:hypothetical protein B0H14DRAFT_2343664, partial [Mycena olivaceomarginata]